jgi:hypothetical protein
LDNILRAGNLAMISNLALIQKAATTSINSDGTRSQSLLPNDFNLCRVSLMAHG